MTFVRVCYWNVSYFISTDKKSSSWFCARISKFTTSAQDPHMYKVTDLAKCKLTTFSFYSCTKHVYPIKLVILSAKKAHTCYFLANLALLCSTKGTLCPISSTISTVYLFPLLLFRCLCLPPDIWPSGVTPVPSYTVQLFSLSMLSVWTNQFSLYKNIC